jgi:hypothetical protein
MATKFVCFLYSTSISSSNSISSSSSKVLHVLKQCTLQTTKCGSCKNQRFGGTYGLRSLTARSGSSADLCYHLRNQNRSVHATEQWDSPSVSGRKQLVGVPGVQVHRFLTWTPNGNALSCWSPDPLLPVKGVEQEAGCHFGTQNVLVIWMTGRHLGCLSWWDRKCVCLCSAGKETSDASKCK